MKSEGFKLAVCSNSIRASVDLMMKLSKLDMYLDFFLSNEDVKHAKPDPEIYVKAIERMGLAPHEVLIVEDNEHGLAAARASGAHVMAVADVSDVYYEAIKQKISALAA